MNYSVQLYNFWTSLWYGRLQTPGSSWRSQSRCTQWASPIAAGCIWLAASAHCLQTAWSRNRPPGSRDRRCWCVSCQWWKWDKAPAKRSSWKQTPSPYQDSTWGQNRDHIFSLKRKQIILPNITKLNHRYKKYVSTTVNLVLYFLLVFTFRRHIEEGIF